MWHVTGVLEDMPTRAWDLVGIRLDRCRGGLVVPTGDQQGRDIDSGKAIDDRPVAQRANDVEFARPVHRVVDGWVFLDCLERTCNLIRHWHDSTNMALVKYLHRLSVFLVVRGSRRLVSQERRLDVVRQGVAEPIGLADPELHRG